MPDCDYCSAEFEDDDAYLDHLAENHEDELGPIERRRVAERNDDSGGVSRTAIVAGVVGVLVLGAVVGTFLLGGGGGGPDGIEGEALDQNGASQLLQNVQEEQIQRGSHLPSGSEIEYDQFPPTSGPHYGGSWASAGYKQNAPPIPDLVHSLEHGHVVLYYDASATTPEVRQSLQQFAQKHTGDWRSFIAVPNPQDDPSAPFVLTAWGHRLTLQEYDAEAVHAFLSEYLGRGPENPVR